MCTLREPSLDLKDGNGFLDAELYSHKTIAAMQFRLLPVVGVLPGLSGLVWAEGWLQNRRRRGMQASWEVPLQPAPMAWGAWAKVPFEACNGALWLRESSRSSGAAPSPGLIWRRIRLSARSSAGFRVPHVPPICSVEPGITWPLGKGILLNTNEMGRVPYSTSFRGFIFAFKVRFSSRIRSAVHGGLGAEPSRKA